MQCVKFNFAMYFELVIARYVFRIYPHRGGESSSKPLPFWHQPFHGSLGPATTFSTPHLPLPTLPSLPHTPPPSPTPCYSQMPTSSRGSIHSTPLHSTQPTPPQAVIVEVSRRWGARLSPGLEQSLKSNILSNQDRMETNIGRSKVLDDLEQRIGSPAKEAVSQGEISGVGFLLGTPMWKASLKFRKLPSRVLRIAQLAAPQNPTNCQRNITWGRGRALRSSSPPPRPQTLAQQWKQLLRWPSIKLMEWRSPAESV